MSTMIATDLTEFYGSRYDEGLRLSSSIKGQLELARVRELVTRHMLATATRVADIGGGTGVHAQWLRAEGYDADLIDPIPRHVETARACGFRAHLGDARDQGGRQEGLPRGRAERSSGDGRCPDPPGTI